MQCMSVSLGQDDLVEQESYNQANSLTTISHRELQELRSLVESMNKQNISPYTRNWKYCWTYGTYTHTVKYYTVKADGHTTNTTF